MTIRTVCTDRKGTFRSVNYISLRKLRIFPRLTSERGLYSLMICTVYTDRKDTFRSVYGPKIASHLGHLEYFHVLSERSGLVRFDDPYGLYRS